MLLFGKTTCLTALWSLFIAVSFPSGRAIASDEPVMEIDTRVRFAWVGFEGIVFECIMPAEEWRKSDCGDEASWFGIVENAKCCPSLTRTADIASPHAPSDLRTRWISLHVLILLAGLDTRKLVVITR